MLGGCKASSANPANSANSACFFSTLGAEEGDECYRQRGLLVGGLIGQLVEVAYIGEIAAVLSPHQQAFRPLLLVGRGELVQVLDGSG